MRCTMPPFRPNRRSGYRSVRMPTSRKPRPEQRLQPLSYSPMLLSKSARLLADRQRGITWTECNKFEAVRATMKGRAGREISEQPRTNKEEEETRAMVYNVMPSYEGGFQVQLRAMQRFRLLPGEPCVETRVRAQRSLPKRRDKSRRRADFFFRFRSTSRIFLFLHFRLVDKLRFESVTVFSGHPREHA